MIDILAYLDPATGSILVQMVVGGVVGLGVLFRRTLAGLLGIFRRSQGPGAERR